MSVLIQGSIYYYLIHPFLREFIKKKCWDKDSCQNYELAKESLKKGRFVHCLQELHSEQRNFLDIMGEVGKGCTSAGERTASES